VPDISVSSGKVVGHFFSLAVGGDRGEGDMEGVAGARVAGVKEACPLAEPPGLDNGTSRECPQDP
jgi:hypothetical protein